MKLILFSIVILFSLQGCSVLNQTMSSRYIKDCASYGHTSTVYKENGKQCKKNKKILTEILGEGALKAENKRREYVMELTYYSIIIVPAVMAFSLISK